MNKLALTIRFLLFTVFFLAGALAVVLAILAHPELYNYYHNRASLQELAAQNEKIRDLTDQYDARIALIESEPAILRRFSATAFNRKPEAPDTVFPDAAGQQLRAETQKILKAELEPQPVDPLPPWLQRVILPKTRTALFLSGAALVILTFIFFGTPRQKQTS